MQVREFPQPSEIDVGTLSTARINQEKWAISQGRWIGQWEAQQFTEYSPDLGAKTQYLLPIQIKFYWKAATPTLVHTVSESFLQPVSEGVVSSIHLTAQQVLQQRVLSFDLYQDLAKDSKVHNDT